MTTTRPLLPSWRPGATRDAVLRFLNDCRRPTGGVPGRLLRQRRNAVV